MLRNFACESRKPTTGLSGVDRVWLELGMVYVR